MNIRLALPLVLVAVCTATLSYGQLPPELALGPPGDHPSVWSGVYSLDQAERGRVDYRMFCERCHRGDVDLQNKDARLVGRGFMERWREYELDSLFAFIKASMPRRNPESLADETYIDIVAYLLNLNKFPLGNRDLTISTLDSIRLEGQDGPQPVPSGALVEVVGCLTQDVLGNWTLMESGEPQRTDTSYSSTAEEMESALTRSLGSQTFRLQNLNFLKDFDPSEHAGRRMQAKGYLIRQPERARIDLTSMQAVSAECSRE